MIRSIPLIFVAAVFIFIIKQADAQNLTQVDELILAPTVINADQAQPLNTLIKVTFPKRVRTIGDAMQYLLAGSGWSLARGAAVDPAQETLLAQPLPEVQRTLKNCPLWHALAVLANEDVFDLERDPPNRQVAFTLKPKYRSWRDDPATKVVSTVIPTRVALKTQRKVALAPWDSR